LSRGAARQPRPLGEVVARQPRSLGEVVARHHATASPRREVVARYRATTSRSAQQPRPLGKVVARHRATTSPLRGGCRATTSPLRGGCRAITSPLTGGCRATWTARQPRPLGEVVARCRERTACSAPAGMCGHVSKVARHKSRRALSAERPSTPSARLLEPIL